MCWLEEQLLDNCPLASMPLFYCRYVDDTFILFRDKDRADTFLQYANAAHPNIKFTIEYETNKKLSFLDTHVTREVTGFLTSVFRKRTFTGLGINFYSSCFYNFKLNALKTLFHRAYLLTSTWAEFHDEILFLGKFFTNNYFPNNIFQKQLNKFMNSKLRPKTKYFNVPKMPFYCSVPYLFNNGNFYSKLEKLISKHCPAIKCDLIPVNPLSIKSLFRYKDKLSPLMTSNIIYLFTCPKCQLGKYVGASKRLLKVRIDSHRGVSYRTNNKITNPEFSNIRVHTKKCKIEIQYKHFEILGRASSPSELSVYESLFIKKVVPHLNNRSSAAPLYIA